MKFKILSNFNFYFLRGYLEVCCLFSKYLGIFHIFMLLTSHLLPLWLENIFYMIWILSHSLSLFLWSRIYSILVNPTCSLKSVFYCVWMEWSIKVNQESWLIALFKSSIPLMIFSQLHLSLNETRVMKSQITIVDLSILLCGSLALHCGLEPPTRQWAGAITETISFVFHLSGICVLYCLIMSAILNIHFFLCFSGRKINPDPTTVSWLKSEF